MIILVQSSPTSLANDHGRQDALGVLSSPRRFYRNVDGWKYAADNDCFSGWDERRYRIMLNQVADTPGCLFVTAPDVVADADATLERFYEWRHDLEQVGAPIAFVAQDGLQEPPWGWFDALFIGGTTGWKLGVDAARLAAEAKRRGLWVHMGRVNSARRIRYAQSIGCDSVDGSGYSMFRRTHLPRALDACQGTQGRLLSM